MSGSTARFIGRNGRRGTRYSLRLAARGSRATARQFQSFVRADGAVESGLARLAELHTVGTAGDAALTVSLAGTVFAMPTDEARSQVALFLLLTMAPFVLLAPLIGPLLDRFRHGRRWAIGGTLATRGFLAWVLASAVVEDSVWLFPAALGCLVASRTYTVTRAAALPRLAPPSISLVKANSRLTVAGLVGMVLGGGLAGALSRVGPDWALRATFLIFVGATILAIRLPARVDSTIGESGPMTATPKRLRKLPRHVRYVLWLVTGARVLSGFLTLFLLFLMREHPIDGWNGTVVLGAVVAAAGIGNAIGSVLGNLRRSLRPELMASVLTAAGIAATLLTTVFYSVWAVVFLGFVTGVYAQLGKLNLDTVVQRDVPEAVRTRVFSWIETMLQSFWVIGGGLGIVIPLEPVLGFGLMTVILVVFGLVALRSRATERARVSRVRADRDSSA